MLFNNNKKQQNYFMLSTFIKDMWQDYAVK